MASYTLKIPEDLHDKLRMEKIQLKKDMRDIIVDLIQSYFKNKEKEVEQK